MTTAKTLNQIIAEIEAWASSHLQVHSFGQGDIWEVSPSSSAFTFPLMWVTPSTAEPRQNELVEQFNVIVCDLVDTGEANELEVLSDTRQILKDLVAWYRQQHSAAYIVEFQGAITPFTERFAERVSGNALTVRLRQPDDYDECAIPLGTPIPAPPFCEPATYTLNDTSTPPNQLSTGSIPSGGSAVIVAPDGNIELNGTPVGVVASGGTTDIPVIQDGSPVGSWNGTQWVIPSCPAGGSISVAVSDASPDFGDTITITATPTSFTPFEYIYLLFDGVNVTLLAQQAGNTFNWSITQAAGTYEVYVLATDGSTNVFDSIEVIINSAYYLNKWPDNVLSAVSMQRLASTYAGDMLRARVSAVEQNIGFNGDLRDNTALATFAGSSNAFMPRWDNQTGVAAGNFTQTTAAQQPRVAAAGIPEQSGGFDSCLFSNSRMVSTAMDALTVSDQPFTYHLVAEWRTTANVLQSAFIAEPTGANSYHTLWRLTSNGNIQWTKRLDTSANQKRLEALLPLNQRVLVTIDYDSSTGTGRLYINGQLVDSGDMSGVFNTPLPSPTFGAFANGVQPFEGEWLESIFHGASQFAAGDIVAQMNNIMTRHGL